MKKQYCNRLFTIALAVLVAFAFLLVPQPEKTLAGGSMQDPIKYSSEINVYPDLLVLDMGSRLKGADSVKVTSSKKAVAEPLNDWDPEYPSKAIWFEAKKSGTATLTIKVTKGGKTSKYKCKVNVKKYKNPVKGFKVGDKGYSSKFKKKCFGNGKIAKQGKQKVSIKPAKGWTVKKITFRSYNMNTDSASNKTVKGKKTMTIKIKDPETHGQEIDVKLYNKSLKINYNLVLFLVK